MANRLEECSVHFNFVEDSEHDELGLLAMKFTVELLLDRYPKGKIIVVVEHAGFDIEDAFLLERAVNEDGVTPSRAYVDVTSPAIWNDNLPLTSKLLVRSIGWIAKKAHKHMFAHGTFGVLNDITEAYPHRVGLLMEGTPEQERFRIASADVSSLYTKSTDFVRKGSFNEGIPYFQQFSAALAESSSARQSRLATRIMQCANNDPDIIAFVSLFGSGHTFLAHKLRAYGFPVDIGYNNQDEGTHYLFPPHAVPIRKLIFNPEAVISDKEWQWFLVGSAIHDSIPKESQRYVEGQDKEGNTDLAWRCMNKIKKPEDIEAFGRAIKQDGFQSAVSTLLSVAIEDYLRDNNIDL